MADSGVTLSIVPLVPRAISPRPAVARTRASIPPGYGTQEQCLPFTAASALGFLIPSPIRFGLCATGELPQGCRAFRSPVAGAPGDERVFYVFDDPECNFSGNAYQFRSRSTPGIREPGISFFDRADQQHLFKLHLPYIWRTPDSIDTLFLPPLNRAGRGFEVQCGLVETDWYASPVNLVLGKPAGPVHVEAGDTVAQAILVPRHLRRPALETAADHSRISRDALKGLAEWDRQHEAQRSAYKILARSRHGRVEGDAP